MRTLLLPLFAVSLITSAAQDADKPAKTIRSTATPSQPSAHKDLSDRWERSRQCAEQADSLASRLKWHSEKSTGDVGWASHYNPERQRCFVVMTSLMTSDKTSDKKELTVFEEIYDGFDGIPLGNRLIDSIGNRDLLCNVASRPWTEPMKQVDCTEYKRFLQDRLGN
jgi:hypothetical protein